MRRAKKSNPPPRSPSRPAASSGHTPSSARGGEIREVLAKGRLEAFSDGVFAIAITLLVLDLHVPRGLSQEALTSALLALKPQLLAYTLSFAIVGVYWTAHHVMVHALRHFDRTLLWLNSLFLFCVSSIPFTASLLGSYPDQRSALTIYGANLVAASLCLQILWRYATYRYRLLDPAIDSRLIRAGNIRTTLSIVIYLAAIGMSFLSPPLSGLMYWLVPLGYIFAQAILDRSIRVSQQHVAATMATRDADPPPSTKH